MKIFEMQYTARLREQKDYCSAIIRATNETSALKKFAKWVKIEDYRQFSDKNFHWEDENSDWLYWFKCINEMPLLQSVRIASLGRENAKSSICIP